MITGMRGIAGVRECWRGRHPNRKNSQGTEARPICRKSVKSSGKKSFEVNKHAGKQA